MKNIFFILISLILFSAYFKNINAKTVTTVCNGRWNNKIIWSDTAQFKTVDTLLIKHYIAFDSELVLNDSTIIIIEKYGELCGPYKLTLNKGSKIFLYGQLKMWDIEQHDTIIVFSGGFINTTHYYTNQYLYVHNGGLIKINSGFKCFAKPECTPAVITMNSFLTSNIEGIEYEWLLNSEKISQNNKTIQPAENGYYQVRIKDIDNTYSSYSDSVYFSNNINSLDNILNPTAINVFPNPVNNILNIVFQTPVKDQYTVEIFDLLGRKVFIDVILFSENKKSIDIKELSNNQYIIRIYNISSYNQFLIVKM